MLKKLLRVLAVLLVLLIVAAIVVWLYIDHVAARVLTGSVGYAGEVPCAVESVQVSVLSGSIAVHALHVGNPSGYAPGSMLVLRQAELDVRVGSLWDRPLHIRRLEVSGVVLSIQGGKGGTNVDAFIGNVRRKIGQEGPEGPRFRLRVDHLALRDATVRVGRGLGGNSILTIHLDALDLENVHGENGRGVTPGELVAGIARELVGQGALEAKIDLASLLPSEMLKGLEALTAPAGTLLKGTTDLLTAPLRTLLGPGTRPAGGADRPPRGPTPTAPRTAPAGRG
jgi:hypothetical protein